MTDDKEDKTLEHQEHFTEVAKSRDVEVRLKCFLEIFQLNLSDLLMQLSVRRWRLAVFKHLKQNIFNLKMYLFLLVVYLLNSNNILPNFLFYNRF